MQCPIDRAPHSMAFDLSVIGEGVGYKTRGGGQVKVFLPLQKWGGGRKKS